MDQHDAASGTPLIAACGLHKTYGQAQAVRGISFEVRRGEVVGFLGPNGAGKSTTMKMLTGFLKPTAGIAKIGGLDVAEAPLQARRLLGYLPESAPLYDEMMVIDFLR
ncbi:MAG: ABC transporter ATP-binding protein, partial [Deltaproteobacteria bacterium]